MKKLQFPSIFLSLVFMLSLVAPVGAIEEMEVQASYAVLIDAAYGDILYEQNAHEKAYPASTTKIMTGLLVMEALDQGVLTKDQLITCTSEALADITADSSTQNISVGESLSVADLLHCLLLPSANEAANILAIAVAGDIPTFIEMMNEKAAELGCDGTHFTNPHGLHNDDHYTTAYNMALILQEAMTHPYFVEIVSTAVYTTAPTETKDAREFYNTNALISSWYYTGYTYSNAIGGKTGYTGDAGRCLAVAAEDTAAEEYFISVILGAENVVDANGITNRLYLSESSRLLQWGFDNFKRITISPDSTPVAAMPVTLSQETDEVLLCPTGSIQRTLPIDMDPEAIQHDIELFYDSVEAPVEAGDVLGSYTISYEGEIYGVLDLVALTSVARSELLDNQEKFVELTEIWGTLNEDAFTFTPLMMIGIGAGLVILVLVLAAILAHRKKKQNRKKFASRGNYSGRR